MRSNPANRLRTGSSGAHRIAAVRSSFPSWTDAGRRRLRSRFRSGAGTRLAPNADLLCADRRGARAFRPHRPRALPNALCSWRQAGHTSRNCDSCFVAATVLLERSVVRDQHVPLRAAREVRLTDQPQRPGAPERGLSAESPSKCPVPGTSTRRTRDWCRTTSRNGRWRTCRKRDRPPSRGCTECLATGTRP